jgi:hypothetical protein
VKGRIQASERREPTRRADGLQELLDNQELHELVVPGLPGVTMIMIF